MDSKEGAVAATATKPGNLCQLNFIQQRITTNAVSTCKNEDKKEAIWHRRYAHLRKKNLERIAKDHLVEGLDYNISKNATFCESCVSWKQHEIPFPKTGGKLSGELLGIVHRNVCGKVGMK